MHLHYNNGYTNATQRYVIRTLSLLYTLAMKHNGISQSKITHFYPYLAYSACSHFYTAHKTGRPLNFMVASSDTENGTASYEQQLVIITALLYEKPLAQV